MENLVEKWVLYSEHIEQRIGNGNSEKPYSVFDDGEDDHAPTEEGVFDSYEEAKAALEKNWSEFQKTKIGAWYYWTGTQYYIQQEFYNAEGEFEEIGGIEVSEF